MKNLPCLVQTATEDKLILDGFYAPAPSDTALLYIHGFGSNFYEQPFIARTAEALAGRVHFLTANTRGAMKDHEFFTADHSFSQQGSQFELLEDTEKDITAWISFLETRGVKKVILAGHSLGTYKAIRYLSEGARRSVVTKLILLAPFDSRGVFKLFTGNTNLEEKLEEAKQQIATGHGHELADPKSFGIMVSYKTYVSYYEQSDLNRMFEFCNPAYGFPVLRSVTVPTKIIVGGKDPVFHPSNPGNPEEAMTLLLKHIPKSAGIIIPNADHNFLTASEAVAKEIFDFVS